MRSLRALLLCIAIASGAALTYAYAQTLGAGDVSLRPGRVAVLYGQWAQIADASGAGGSAVWYPNAGAPKVTQALQSPASFFEVTFDAEAGRAYRLWLRMRAQNNEAANDSVFVQFGGSVDLSSQPTFRIGTTAAAEVNLEACKGCGLSGWGWQDNGWGTGVLGPEIYFATTGPQVLRVQSREDGAIIDQILLSPSNYLGSPPGTPKNDATILPESAGSPGPPVTMVRGPYLQQVTSTAASVVWATRENGPAEVRYSAGGATTAIAASTRRVPASLTGFAFDYYQHEARLTGLASGTTYTYQPFVAGAMATPGATQLRTAPAPGSGTVKFVAFGDSGTGSIQQGQIASRISADTFDLALHGGDMVYGAGNGTGDASYVTYQNWFFGLYRSWLGSRPLFPAEGNHDSRPSNNNGAAYLDLFSLPRNGASASYPDHAERYYSFDYGPVHFIALDTEFTFQDATRRSEQIAWLDADLASTTQPWKVAFFHRSPYSAGGEHGSDLTVRSTFGPLFERYGVQLAISAHEHDYERTVPTREGTSGSAVTYIVSGGGGAPLYASATQAWTAYSATRHHYLRATADSCTLRVDAIGLDGQPFDGTTLNRCSEPPPALPDVILYASEAPVRMGAWAIGMDTTAAEGKLLRHADAGAAKITTALASPVNHFELTFDAQANVAYHLWVRGKADGNSWANDSVFVQFSGSTAADGTTPAFRIGSTSGAEVNLEDCRSCGVSGWGWQDNGYGTGVPAPAIYFQTSGPQRIRVQTREDGLAIDQIVLSPARYLNTSPGALKNDKTILTRP